MHVVISGVAGGIGRRVASALVDSGHRVTGLDRDEEGMASLPEPVDARVVDLTEPSAVATELDGIAADVVVTCAGWYAIGALEDCSPDRFRRHLDANLASVHAVVQPLLATLRDRDGRVVIVGSTVGSVPLPFHGGYSAAKAGVAAYADVLRRETAVYGVDVSLIEPGPTRTGLNERAAATLSEADAADVGESAYAEAYEAFDHYSPASVAPEAVAETVVHAATTSRPNARYRVGRRARWLPRLGAVTPTGLFDRLVRAGMPDGWLGRLID